MAKQPCRVFATLFPTIAAIGTFTTQLEGRFPSRSERLASPSHSHAENSLLPLGLAALSSNTMSDPNELAVVPSQGNQAAGVAFGV